MATGHNKRSRQTRAAPVPDKSLDGKELALQLNAVASELQAAYFTCATAEAALLGQDADQDKDIAFCLRLNVADPVHRQVEKLRALARRLVGAARKATEP